MNNLITEKIKLWGVVQGVGFRPFVVKLAMKMEVKGQVLNLGGLVEITITDTKEKIDFFVEELKRKKPKPAEIVHIKREIIETKEFSNFSILESGEGDDEAAMIPADLAICEECQKEMGDSQNPRFEHPLISCMICGPRYTIIDKIPYDRESTRMKEFAMCEFCHEEYIKKTDRRYHAQTVSCNSCGPEFSLLKLSAEPLNQAVRLLKEGKVIGFKSIGGFNLVCNPFDNEATHNLRRIKGRYEKPFAVMFENPDMIREYCSCSLEEEELLKSSARPILLLEKKFSDLEKQTEEFKKSRFIGAFLPSSGAQILMIEKFGGPLIFTSANKSDEPMIKDNKEMIKFVESQLGLISECLINDRDINIRVDDSVVRVIDGQPQMIRRSKGYAPVPIHINLGGNLQNQLSKSIMVLAMGGQLKNSFALSKGPFSYISQYFGDLDSIEASNIYEENISRMKILFKIEPNIVVCDMHPKYNTTIIGEKYAAINNIPLLMVQHHHAHVASVMAEHGIDGPIIGVSFDGTGYGSDGKIWGGEILICEKQDFKRFSHLKYVKMIGGDGSVKGAWKSAMCYIHDLKKEQANLEEDEFQIDISDMIEIEKLTEMEKYKTIKVALEKNINTIESSSMGRLFDSVSSMLGICQENGYEGQCAILLEDAAARAMKTPGANSVDDLALEFHYRVSNSVLEQCKKAREVESVFKVALTGGVFQNKILMERCLKLLREENFEVYYNISVSPNDGGIALGQNYIGIHHQISKL